MTFEEMEPSQILALAHARLLAHGWRQDGDQSENGGMCLVNTVTYISAYAMATSGKVRPYLAMAIFGTPDRQWADIWQWNDVPTTTFTDVLDVLTHAEKLAREDEALA